MTFGEILILSVKYAPTVFQVIIAGGDFIATMQELKKLDSAESKAKDEDDTRPLNNLFPK